MKTSKLQLAAILATFATPIFVSNSLAQTTNAYGLPPIVSNDESNLLERFEADMQPAAGKLPPIVNSSAAGLMPTASGSSSAQSTAAGSASYAPSSRSTPTKPASKPARRSRGLFGKMFGGNKKTASAIDGDGVITARGDYGYIAPSGKPAIGTGSLASSIPTAGQGDADASSNVEAASFTQRAGRRFMRASHPTSQGSGTRGNLSGPMPPVISGTMITGDNEPGGLPSMPMMDGEQMMESAPAESYDAGMPAMEGSVMESPYAGGQMVDAPVMGASPQYSTPPIETTAPAYFDVPPAATSTPVYGSSVATCDCANTGVPSGGCDVCGQNGQNGDNRGPIGLRANCNSGTFGSVSAARRYLHLEYMVMTREDGDISGSNIAGLTDFDTASGARVTIGRRTDAINGREFTYFGFEPTEESRTVTRFGLNANLFPTGGFQQRLLTDPTFGAANPIETSTFFSNPAGVAANPGTPPTLGSPGRPAGTLGPTDPGAPPILGSPGTPATPGVPSAPNQLTEFKDTVLHSFEYNKVRWGWDVVKVMRGFRYIHMEDDYRLNSLNNFGTGQFRIDTTNHLLGAQIGSELFYDVGYRLSISGFSKYGLFANFNQVDHQLINAGTEFLRTDDNTATVSSMFEVGVLGHYQLRPNLRLRGGYTALFLGRMATVADNINPVISPQTGLETGDKDDVFFQGLSLGFEMYR